MTVVRVSAKRRGQRKINVKSAPADLVVLDLEGDPDSSVQKVGDNRQKAPFEFMDG